jgi:hypothetical protein
VYVDNGILSRNYVEALTIKKTKRRRFTPEDLPELHLEKFEPFPKPEIDEIPEKHPLDKRTAEKPAPKVPETDDLHPIKIGKGKIPEESENKEVVKLKKIPAKPLLPEEEGPEKKRQMKPSPDVPGKPAGDYNLELKPLEPLDTGEIPEFPSPELNIPEKPIEEKPKEKKKKLRKEKPSKPEEEPEEKKIIPGVPKPQPEDKEDDLKLRKKQGPLPEEVPEKIVLKPIPKKKPESEGTERQPDMAKFTPSDDVRPEEEVTPTPVDDTPEKKKKRKTKPKAAPEETLEDSPLVEIAPAEEQSGKDELVEVPQVAHLLPAAIPEVEEMPLDQEISVSEVVLVNKDAESLPSVPEGELDSVKEKAKRIIRKKKVTAQTREEDLDSDKPISDLEIISMKRGSKEHVDELEEREIVPRPVAPRFVKPIQPCTCQLEKPATFTCQFEGSPLPSITWYLDNVELYPNESYLMTVLDNVATLEILAPQPENAGIYSCKAANVAGVAVCRANLLVLGICKEVIVCCGCAKVSLFDKLRVLSLSKQTSL